MNGLQKKRSGPGRLIRLPLEGGGPWSEHSNNLRNAERGKHLGALRPKNSGAAEGGSHIQERKFRGKTLPHNRKRTERWGKVSEVFYRERQCSNQCRAGEEKRVW